MTPDPQALRAAEALTLHILTCMRATPEAEWEGVVSAAIPAYGAQCAAEGRAEQQPLIDALNGMVGLIQLEPSLSKRLMQQGNHRYVRGPESAGAV